jgi:DnaK suppressor protein
MTVIPEELTSEEFVELGSLLKVLEKSLEESVLLGNENAKPVDLDAPIGRLSRMDALQQQAMAKATKEKAKIRLAQVRVARTAHEDGEYGFCRRCEEPIGIGRLRSRPETPFCIACQGRSERGS